MKVNQYPMPLTDDGKVSARIGEDAREILDRICRERGMTQQAVLRRLILFADSLDDTGLLARVLATR